MKQVNLNMRNQAIIILSLFICLNAQALSRNQISSCRQGSTSYDTYANKVDNILSEIVKRYRPGSSEFKDNFKILFRWHEDFKDKEYLQLLKVQEALIAENKEQRENIEAWRMFMEGAVDTAFVLAVENMTNEQLGRSSEHYRRRIYDSCIGIK